MELARLGLAGLTSLALDTLANPTAPADLANWPDLTDEQPKGKSLTNHL